MIVHRRTPALWVFGADQDSVQLCWRLLRPGMLRLRVADVDHEIVVDDGPGAVTLGPLPPGRLLTIHASGPALAEPIELTARTLGALPGEELTRVATLSDLHVGTVRFGHRHTIADPDDHDRAHPYRCTTAAIGEATEWGAERLLVKGDLTNAGLAHQWREYAELVHASPVPVDAIIGNHDHAYSNSRSSVAPADAAEAHGLTIADPLLVRDLPGLRVILLDSTQAGRNQGTVAAVAADAVEAAAEAPHDGGVLVLLHHQLQPHRLPEGWPMGVPHAESRSFLDDLGHAHPHVIVSSGHTHRHRRWGRAGVVVTQVGSTKDYPGVWAGYRVHEGGIAQTVHRVEHPDCIRWTDHTRTAAFGLWEHTSPGRLDARCFNVAWSVRTPRGR